MPEKIPVTIEAAPNIPATEAYSGSTVLKTKAKTEKIFYVNSMQNCVTRS